MPRLLIAILAGAAAFGAHAQGVPATGDTGGQDQQAQQDAERPAAIVERNCLRHTGSRIRPVNRSRDKATQADAQQGRCINAVGRSYTREDLERTGRIDIRSALRSLDPTVY